MLIDGLRLYRVAHNEPSPESDMPLESVLVEMTSGPHTGWGEVTLESAPIAEACWAGGELAVLSRWLGPALRGAALDSGESLQERLAAYQGHHAAKSALDLAWWNLLSAERSTPLGPLWGVSPRDVSLAPVVPARESNEEFLSEIGQWFDRGAELVVLKLRPGWAVEMVRGVRRAYPTQPLAVDCDGLCTLDQLDLFYRLEDFFLKFIEQPFAADDLVAHAMLQQAIRTPVTLDQSVTSLARIEQAIDLGSCRQMRLTPRRLGGLSPLRAAVRRLNEVDIECMLGGAPQGWIAALAAAALAGSDELSAPAEIFFLQLASSRAAAEPGRLACWSRPTVNVANATPRGAIDRGQIEQLAREHIVVF